MILYLYQSTINQFSVKWPDSGYAPKYSSKSRAFSLPIFLEMSATNRENKPIVQANDLALFASELKFI